MATRLSLLDRLLYRYVLIPRTRKQLIQSNFVIVGAALWSHSQNPHAEPALWRQMQDLKPELTGLEKDTFAVYRYNSP